MIQGIILWLVLAILVVLVMILGIIIYHCFFRSPGVGDDIIIMEEGKGGNRIDLEQVDKEYGDVMVEGGDFDKERQKAIEDLRLFALEKMEKENNKMKGSPGEIRVSGQGTGPVGSGKEYIPYNLSEQDKAILRAFNEL